MPLEIATRRRERAAAAGDHADARLALATLRTGKISGRSSRAGGSPRDKCHPSAYPRD